MKTAALLALTILFTCSPDDHGSTSATEGSTSSEPPPTTTGGEGYLCDGVGAACDVVGPDCAAGLDCVELPDSPGVNVCAQRCNLEGGVNAEPCKIGWCDVQNFAATGMCRDGDGLPVGLCDGVPSCAGDHCTDACANGLTCLVGSCAFACATAKDCAEGQACLAGACFDGDGLANPCN